MKFSSILVFVVQGTSWWYHGNNDALILQVINLFVKYELSPYSNLE